MINSFTANTLEPHSTLLLTSHAFVAPSSDAPSPVTCYLLYKKFIFTEADPVYPPESYVSELLYHQVCISKPGTA